MSKSYIVPLLIRDGMDGSADIKIFESNEAAQTAIDNDLYNEYCMNEEAATILRIVVIDAGQIMVNGFLFNAED